MVSLTLSKTCEWVFVVEGPDIVIDPTMPPVPQVGVAYTFTFKATGGTGFYTWSVDPKNADGSDSVLPAGLALSAEGVMSGTPTTTSAVDPTTQQYVPSKVTIRVKDSAK